MNKGQSVTDRDAITVLSVDPEGTTGAVFDERAGFDSVTAATFEGALDVIGSREIDCVVAEYELTGGTAFELFERSRAIQPNVGCVLYTTATLAEIDLPEIQGTVAEYLRKGDANGEGRVAETVRRIVADRTQAGFPLPDDENERLETVAAYDIDGLAGTETFDRLSRLLTSHFDNTVSFIGLLDEFEERFLACHGADWDSLNREDSICTHAILEEDVTVIEDIETDPRFENNETLERLGIRSYAGANITAENGKIIGELCLIDDEPRTYTDEERADLQLFAEEVSEQLELRRRIRKRDPEGEP